jgi:hypothetical protein
MVILQTDLDGVLSVPSERDPPITAGVYSIPAAITAPELMEA